MKQRAGRCSFPSLRLLEDFSSMTFPDSRNRGYAFLVLMLIVTVLLISLTAALPSIYTQGQREKEEELIFRGNQYARAAWLFHRQFGHYPSTVDDMVKKT